MVVGIPMAPHDGREERERDEWGQLPSYRTGEWPPGRDVR